jgi:hypothetical protein
MFQVEQVIRQVTGKCPNDFACLNCTPNTLCRVLACIEGGTLFIVCRHPGPCPYRKGVADRDVCSCPTRIRIFERYRL